MAVAGYGEMDIKDVGKVLRWMGYTASFDVQVMLTREVDVDESGTLDAVELRKLVRRFQEKARSFYSFFGGNSYGILNCIKEIMAFERGFHCFPWFSRVFEMDSGAHRLDPGLSEGPHARGALSRGPGGH